MRSYFISLAVLAAFAFPTPVQSADRCPAVMIDVGGFHAAQVGLVYAERYVLPITAFAIASVFDVPARIDQAVECGARVINFSLDLGDTPDLRAAVLRAQAADVLIVAAAGNRGPDTPTAYPGAYPGAIAVGALSGLSNPSDVLAVGSSTSIASAHVAGVAAEIRSRYPSLSAMAVRFAILSTRTADGALDAGAAMRSASMDGRYVVAIPAVVI